MNHQDRSELLAIRERTAEIMAQITAPAANHKENQWICPRDGCSHGTHGDGIMFNPKSTDGLGLKCHGCGWSGDVIDLLGEVYHLTPAEAIHKAKGMLGMEDTSFQAPATRARTTAATSPKKGEAPAPAAGKDQQGRAPAKEPTPAPAPDQTEYFKTCNGRISEPAAFHYLAERGISLETARAYNLGFDPEADPAGAGHPCPRIIIPTTNTHYIGRSIDPSTPKKYAKLNNKGGVPGLFNEAALFPAETEPVFLVEGAFDALAIIEAGTAAVALNSTSNVDKLLKLLEKKPTKATLIVCLDTDKAGKSGTEALVEGLARLHVSYSTAEICGEYNDPNEAWVKDYEQFTEAIENAKLSVCERPYNTSLYIDHLMATDIKRFKETGDIKTGFPNLDAQCGGLYAGLYVIAAASSLGKTTFTLQLADQLAASGHDVLFFSMEQSKLEMVSKSLARITAQKDAKTAVSSLSIRKGYLPPQVLDAVKSYKAAVGEHMSIIQGNFRCTVKKIEEDVDEYRRRTGKTPIVFVDYLQIIQGDPKDRMTTKEAVDHTVTELKQMSQNLNVPVVVISSINRANYLTPIDFEALKESGGIEFTCDVLWGLQLACLSEDPLFENAKEKIKEKREKIREEKAKTPRRIELVCLKNRYGVASFSCKFKYFPQNDLYLPEKDSRGSRDSGSSADGRKFNPVRIV